MLREVISNEWFVVLIVLCLVFLSLAKLSAANRFNDFIGLISNSNYLKIYSRDQKFVDQFDALLFLNLIISAALFIFFSYDYFIMPLEFDPLMFLELVAGIAVVLLIKILIERLIGSVFEIDEIIEVYLFQKTNYKNYVGILLLIFNIILFFGLSLKGFQPYLDWVLYAMIGMLFLLVFSGFITTFREYQKLLLSNLSYFILYLCALEFGPYIILYKVLN